MPTGKGTAWAVWSALTAGTGMVGVGFFRDLTRFRQWRRARAEQEGEIVYTERALRVGQVVQIGEADSVKRNATLCAVDKKTLRLRIERQTILTKDAAPPAGAILRLSVTGDGAVYRFDAPVIDIVSRPTGNGDTLITVKCPAWMTRVQRRRHVRVPLSLPATFEFARPTNRITECMTRHGVVLDLSAGGLCADLGGPMGLLDSTELLALLPTDTILRTRLPIPALTEPLLVRVRLSDRVAVQGGLGVRIACEFLPMPPWEQDLIAQYIFRHQNAPRGSGGAARFLAGSVGG